jgi:terminal uridylyltransferase
MFPPSQDGRAAEGGDLESRLRGLILSNSNTIPTASSSENSNQGPHLPPHMLSATPQEKQTYLENANNARSSVAAQNSDPRSNQPKNKRPNQAQRRQMSSNLSIPIDNRPNQTRSPGLGPPSGQKHIQWNNQGFRDQPPQKGHSRQSQAQNFNQQYSPRYNNNNNNNRPSTPYSPHKSFDQSNQHSPIPQHQSNRVFQSHQSPQNQSFEAFSYSSRPSQQGRQLYQPGLYQSHGHSNHYGHNADDIVRQSSYLENLLQQSVPVIGMDTNEETEKEAFRAVVEQTCRGAISAYEQNEIGNDSFDPLTVELQCFGSMKSGFATKASDMDLALLSPKSSCLPDSPDSLIPRILEKALLGMGFGARLLTRTRVPIIKLCQQPNEKLKADLLQEREKWEKGFPEDAPDVDDDVVVTQIDLSFNGHEPIHVDNSAKAENDLQSLPSPTKMADSYHDKLASLKQKKSQSLGDYHANAKRLLRQLGSRDITSFGAPDVTDEEAKILNDVCRAFISGLASDVLIGRLMGYPSVSALFDQNAPFIRRTLQGSWQQADGERMALNWAGRPLTEESDKREFECQEIVRDWETLQQNPAPCSHEEFIKFNRDLYLGSERLKKVSSLQLMCLEQIPHEEPVNYFFRVKRLLEALTGNTRQESIEVVESIVVQHYIDGINSSDIRLSLKESTGANTSLYLVAIQHRVLQLVADYEHALKTGVYNDVDRPIIEQYMEYLKSINTSSPGFKVRSLGNGGDPVMISRVRLLPDPSATSLNKPRDRYKDHLEFPKSGIGIQCDINFSAHLGIHNTLLLRCYSHCDPRVKLMILFVKNWAKLRGINTPYRGSLSSYGYVLMVLHYLVNIAHPFVCPNLQEINRDPPSYLPPAEIEARTSCNGYDVRFWRNEAEIKSLADRKMLNHNHDSIGFLLRGFFEYYAQNGAMTTVQHRGFDWGREVLSLRTRGGILTKQDKGWVGAKTTVETNIIAPPTPSTTKPISPTTDAHPQDSDSATKPKPARQVEEVKEIRHRYLFAIEDPFELTHNVARTVTHNGIVSIRDEFRRAWRILRNIDKPEQRDGGLLDAVKGPGEGDGKESFYELLEMLHGPASKQKETKRDTSA